MAKNKLFHHVSPGAAVLSKGNCHCFWHMEGKAVTQEFVPKARKNVCSNASTFLKKFLWVAALPPGFWPGLPKGQALFCKQSKKKTVERNKTEKNRGMFFGVLNRISPLNCEILVITYFQLPKSEVMICRNVYSRKPKKKKRKEKSDGK